MIYICAIEKKKQNETQFNISSKHTAAGLYAAVWMYWVMLNLE